MKILPETTPAMIDPKNIKSVAGISKAQAYRLMHLGRFPKPIQLSERRVAWLSSEIDEWLYVRVQARNNGTETST